MYALFPFRTFPAWLIALLFTFGYIVVVVLMTATVLTGLGVSWSWEEATITMVVFYDFAMMGLMSIIWHFNQSRYPEERTIGSDYFIGLIMSIAPWAVIERVDETCFLAVFLFIGMVILATEAVKLYRIAEALRSTDN